MTEVHEEIWRDVPGYEGRYLISNLGNLKSLIWWRKKKTRVVIPSISINGYLYVGLNDGCVIKTYGIHRLVAMAFIPNTEGKPEVNHINRNPQDNRPSNLEWMTEAENIRHSWKNPNRKRKTPKNIFSSSRIHREAVYFIMTMKKKYQLELILF